MQEEQVCVACRRPKASLNCGSCQESVCKNCAQFLDESTFSFLKEIPKELSHTYYCPMCHDSTVAPALDAYREVMDRAQQAYVFFITQRKPIPLLKKSKEKVSVKACEDRDETILRLAFFAAQEGYNAVTQVVVESEKIRNAGYEKSVWRGEGIPALVDAEKLERRK